MAKKHVLLVDDSNDILSFLDMFLKRLDIVCTKANTGYKAIKTYDKDLFDIVFLDLQLTDMSGFEVLENIKKADPKARVIMITGKAEKDFEDRARQLGAMDYITKPLDLSELRVIVSKYVLEQQP